MKHRLTVIWNYSKTYLVMKKIQVLIVDDSALMRALLTDILHKDPAIQVVGVAKDPYDARAKIKQLNPDVLTLDVEMPKMDGVTFLSYLMRLRPMPVVMVSTLTKRGADVTFKALALGAVDFIHKPAFDQEQQLQHYTQEIIHKIKVAAEANVQAPDLLKSDVIHANIQALSQLNIDTTDKILAIGASTGGTEALKELLPHLPNDCPGIVITQHMPPAFTKPFALHLGKAASLPAKEAEEGDPILPGHIYVAPGNIHLQIRLNGARYCCSYSDAPEVNRFKPSVDVLFDSVAAHAGKNAIGVLLTGMGKDGAKGLHALHSKGARTIAQDEASSVVWGMPGAAVALGAADHILPLNQIAPKVVELVSSIGN